MTATDEIRRFPEEGEIITASIRQVTGHGVYVTLDEYNITTGFLHISEIATGWIRNMERYIRRNQKAVPKVIRANKVRGEVDTSLKQVSGEECKSKLIEEEKKSHKANVFLYFVKSKLNLSDQQCEEIEDTILQKYLCIYDAFEALSRKDLEAIQDIELLPKTKNAIEDASKTIRIPVVEISGIMQITSRKPEGTELIKNTLANADGNKGSASAIITYIGSPRCRVVVNAEKFKVAERLMDNIIEKTRASIEKQHGTFNFVHQHSKRSQTLQQV